MYRRARSRSMAIGIILIMGGIGLVAGGPRLVAGGPGPGGRGAGPMAGGDRTPLEQALPIYLHADHLFHLDNAYTTPATDSAAMAGFEKVIHLLESRPDLWRTDTLFAFSWLKKGAILDGEGDYARAGAAYRRVLDIRRKDDSLDFVVNVYAGTVYYNLNNFDSARYFLQKADSIGQGKRNKVDEARLYNTLGVLFYDNGNYQQAQNYFSHALRLLEEQRPYDTISSVNFQTNIATSFYKLGYYEEALVLFQKALGYRYATNYIYINMGRTYAALDKYAEALACFRRVDAVKVPSVLNEMGATQEQLRRPDSCAWYLDRFQAIARDPRVKLNLLDQGVNQLYRADLLADGKEYSAALACLQQSIILFSHDFHNKDIFSNPSNFTGAFAYYRLFDALLKKARLFDGLYASEKKEAWLKAAYESYMSALSLLRYIEKSYDTDDAKLFLKKKSAGVYDGALAACLQLYRLHGGGYLEGAYGICEKSKATIIFANLKENAFTGTNDPALAGMRNCKYHIARLNVQLEATSDSMAMEGLARQKRDDGITLARLQKQLEQNNAYYKLKYDDSQPGLKELQGQLGKGQVLISYYVTAGVLHSFILTDRSIHYHREDSVTLLQDDAASWLKTLKATESGRRFKTGDMGERLYSKLVKPIQEKAPGRDEWIIVPDGFLYYLPFESLPGGAGVDYLLRTTTISYRLSTRLLSALGARAEGETMRVLAFAPFAGGAGVGGADSGGAAGSGVGGGAGAAFGGGGGVRGDAAFARLPASRDEIAGLAGVQYIDSAATKNNFLKNINRYPIIHLATHAISSPSKMAGSYIAFYPDSRAPDENNLYLEELYGLNLNATQLVVISACETGQGELAGKEGVISLSRAFAYAGCASTINSLWKADDKATAYILKQFYLHLQKGVTKARALQQAKLDYLSGDFINKSPAYWSHLILMGDERPLYGGTRWSKWGLLLLLAGMGGVIYFLYTVSAAARRKTSP